MSTHGEVLRWSTDSDKEEITDTREERTIDSVESTPDICKSSDIIQGRVQGSIATDKMSGFKIQARQEKNKFTYTGVSSVKVKETELQESGSDSEDDVPIATALTTNKKCSLTLQKIEDCNEGPKNEKALGVTVAKKFDGVEFRGTVDSWRSARKRSYYHVIYTDGDEEELSQTELRDGYLLGLSHEIETE